MLKKGLHADLCSGSRCTQVFSVHAGARSSPGQVPEEEWESPLPAGPTLPPPPPEWEEHPSSLEESSGLVCVCCGGVSRAGSRCVVGAGLLPQCQRAFPTSPPRPPGTRGSADEVARLRHHIVFLLQVVLAGAFYPNYFTFGQPDEEMAVRELAGKDPKTTIVVGGGRSLPQGALAPVPRGLRFCEAAAAPRPEPHSRVSPTRV